MDHSEKILVVGTTDDYIELLTESFPGRMFFITDLRETRKRKGLGPGKDQEILLDLEERENAMGRIKAHLQEFYIAPVGVTCFDCESLALASAIAEEFDLSFSSPESVMNCRSKYRSKKIWKEKGIPSPQTYLLRSEEEAINIFDVLGGPVVMKPLTGSGSELVLLCVDGKACGEAYRTIIDKLKNHTNTRMYAKEGPAEEDPRCSVVAEEYIPGEEYSCDFILEKSRARILRLARKIGDQGEVFGTTAAYILQTELPGGWTISKLEKRLQSAAEKLGLEYTIAMVDLKINEGEVFLLEMTPRPGGDCLPPLIKASSGFDILGAALDLAERKKVTVPDKKAWDKVAGVHIIASDRGVLKKIEAPLLEKDPRVISHQFKRTAGDRIELPPEDYDSRILGYVLFRPSSEMPIEDECRDIRGKITVEIG